jgi:hypothetical protein
MDAGAIPRTHDQRLSRRFTPGLVEMFAISRKVREFPEAGTMHKVLYVSKKARPTGLRKMGGSRRHGGM